MTPPLLFKALLLLILVVVAVVEPFQVHVAVIPGVDSNRPSKVNQDSYFVSPCPSEVGDNTTTFVGVLDGHGIKGHLVSQYCAQELSKLLHLPSIPPIPTEYAQQLRDLGGDDCSDFLEDRENNGNEILPPDQHLIRAFHSVQYSAMQNTSIPAGRSGTTCIVCQIDPTKQILHVAFCGDSRAILLSHVDDDVDDNDDKPSWSIQVLAHETTTKIPSERRRIEAGQGRIDGGGNVWYGPVAIAMTRALGDAVMLRAGILPTPLVTRSVSYRPGRDCLILATDGVWDPLSNEQVGQIVTMASNFTQLADVIARTARDKWIGDFIDETADDITCMVVEL